MSDVECYIVYLYFGDIFLCIDNEMMVFVYYSCVIELNLYDYKMYVYCGYVYLCNGDVDFVLVDF